MKKAMISFLFCLVTAYMFGQDFCHYVVGGQNVGGQKECFPLSASKMLVCSETLDIDDLKDALQNTVAGNLKYIEEVGNWLFFVEMQNTSMEDMQELILQWRAREDVIYTSPVFGAESDFEGGSYTNEVCVMLKSNNDYPVLQEYAEDYQIKDIIPPGEYSPWYTLILLHNPEKDAMQVALELYETGLFVYAEPEILWLWPFGPPDNNDFPERWGFKSSVCYPNPARDVIYVDLDKITLTPNKTAATYDIRLYDSQGKMLYQVKAKDGIVELNVSNVSNVPDGIYFLHINDGISTTPKALKVFVKH